MEFPYRIYMKIISKLKDYYDYLSGIYGIDNDIIYDRRKCEEPFDCLYKSQKKFYNHSFEDNEIENFILLEIGNMHYIFSIYQYITNRNIEEFYNRKHELINKYKTDKKISNAPVAMIMVDAFKNRNNELIIRRKYEQTKIDNPILINTWIPSYIPANEIYELIYEYLISEREPKINDNRSDVEKLESKGFDKKTSFRHPIK